MLDDTCVLPDFFSYCYRTPEPGSIEGKVSWQSTRFGNLSVLVQNGSLGPPSTSSRERKARTATPYCCHDWSLFGGLFIKRLNAVRPMYIVGP
jgi:hypothetical protein